MVQYIIYPSFILKIHIPSKYIQCFHGININSLINDKHMLIYNENLNKSQRRKGEIYRYRLCYHGKYRNWLKLLTMVSILHIFVIGCISWVICSDVSEISKRSSVLIRKKRYLTFPPGSNFVVSYHILLKRLVTIYYKAIIWCNNYKERQYQLGPIYYTVFSETICNYSITKKVEIDYTITCWIFSLKVSNYFIFYVNTILKGLIVL